MECETKIYEARCKCILYYMPKTDHNVSICGTKDIRCVIDTYRYLKSKKVSCDCLPGCFELSYQSEISMSPLNQNAKNFHQNHLDVDDLAVLHIFFREHYFRSQKKQELITFTELLCKSEFLYIV